jgi:hypothetical protein
MSEKCTEKEAEKKEKLSEREIVKETERQKDKCTYKNTDNSEVKRQRIIKSVERQNQREKDVERQLIKRGRERT